VKKLKTKTKQRASTAIHLHARLSTVNGVFTFNASAICAAPSALISFPVYFRENKAHSVKNLKRGQKTIHLQ